MGGLYWLAVIVLAYLTVGVTTAYYLARADSEWTADYGFFHPDAKRENPGPGSVTFVTSAEGGEVTEAEGRAVSVGRNYLLALDDARMAQDELDDYNHNADPTGEIEQRLKREFAARVHDLAIWTRALTRVVGL